MPKTNVLCCGILLRERKDFTACLALSHSFSYIAWALAWFPTFEAFSLCVQYGGTSALPHMEKGQMWEKSSAGR